MTKSLWAVFWASFVAVSSHAIVPSPIEVFVSGSYGGYLPEEQPGIGIGRLVFSPNQGNRATLEITPSAGLLDELRSPLDIALDGTVEDRRELALVEFYRASRPGQPIRRELVGEEIEWLRKILLERPAMLERKTSRRQDGEVDGRRPFHVTYAPQLGFPYPFQVDWDLKTTRCRIGISGMQSFYQGTSESESPRARFYGRQAPIEAFLDEITPYTGFNPGIQVALGYEILRSGEWWFDHLPLRVTGVRGKYIRVRLDGFALGASRKGEFEVRAEAVTHIDPATARKLRQRYRALSKDDRRQVLEFLQPILFQTAEIRGTDGAALVSRCDAWLRDLAIMDPL